MTLKLVAGLDASVKFLSVLLSVQLNENCIGCI